MQLFIKQVFFFIQFLDYKGNSPPAQTINIESVESNTNSKQACARDTSNMSTNGINNDNPTRNHASSADETDGHSYNDAIFRIGKVYRVSQRKEKKAGR